MSHINNKVRWCLNKAEKELAQNQKHRGLIRVPPNLEEAKKHIAKAEHNFKAALLLEESYSDWSVNACFYTIYHCFLAIITKQGYESRNQECTIALVKHLKEANEIIVDDDIVSSLDFEGIDLESNVINMRENFQYGTETSVRDKKLEALKELCKRAIEQAKREIY